MNNSELTERVNASMARQCQQRGYASTVDVLMDIGVLERKNYEAWRAGRIPYLEKVCTMNLNKLSNVLHQMRVFGRQAGLKPSYTAYRHKGKALRFSKFGRPEVEQAYATHWVADPSRKKDAAAPAGKAPSPRAKGTQEGGKENGRQRKLRLASGSLLSHPPGGDCSRKLPVWSLTARHTPLRKKRSPGKGTLLYI